MELYTLISDSMIYILIFVNQVNPEIRKAKEI